VLRRLGETGRRGDECGVGGDLGGWFVGSVCDGGEVCEVALESAHASIHPLALSHPSKN
jgi:hypothetical protein